MIDLDELRKQVVDLDSDDDACRRRAIHSLKQVEAKDWADAPPALIHSAVVTLQAQLRGGTKPPFINKDVATILGNIGPRAKSVVPLLISLLQEGVPDPLRETAAVALGKFGGLARDAVDPLLALCHGRTPLAMQAVKALSEIGCADQRVRAGLVGLWQASIHSQSSQANTASALCKLRIAVPGLLRMLTHNLSAGQDESLRRSAAEGLAWCDKADTDVVPALLAATLGDKHEEVRKLAQAALDQMQVSHEQGMQLCAKHLETSTIAETALRKCGPNAVPALIDALGASAPATRIKAAHILGSLGDAAAPAVPALTTALHDKDSEIRLAAAKSLWNVTKNGELVVPALVKLLDEKRAADDEDEESRRRYLQTVIEALWRIGPPAQAAARALAHKAKDTNRFVSESARNALARITPSPAK
jgi:HEAT repeat protein